MNYQMIETDDALASLCEAVRACPAIALDTEFVRTRTYYPQLGLIQLFDGANVALIDPLGISDWSPLKAVLRDTGITKFLHAGSEDLEVFLNAFGELPEPLIDTQILAAFCGRPLSWGFAAMVEEYTGVALDKSESRTDWLARPLSERQCEYAAADVWYLLPIAKKLMIETEAAGWLPAALDECRLMQQRRQEIQVPEEAWRDITNAWQLRTRQLACLQLLADWRLRKARERDMAVNFVVREENLWAVARYMPGSLGELDSLGLSGSEIRFHGKTLISLVAKAQALPEEALPEPLLNLMDMPGYRKAFKAIKALVAEVSASHHVSGELLASRRQINQLLNWHWKLKPQNGQPELISGWRAELMAEKLTLLLQEYPR
ncbi:ribonuclease D [Salmonella enterica]|uniref:Ribonuclease D n=2 Tax=Salmonella enterica TaxID=28901 RepID=A0A748UZC7_SALER|nr:ribonuclease D [Salmonella enterica]EAY2655289.1 ribonuclease D [Salmonella enterica subsp. enterica serovar Typhimurium]EBN3541321.1 ribonuclease D [Salmonella enterica subsp. enterica serovar Newport]EBS6602971.1 ribonuclease D [Salmonella enterica subsp. enterica serovar Indiana]ECF4096949.1 ribonuclease D [Salmonella enterica subsp. enterica serovar Adelaide]ECG1408602.1 ribonuclease D [Salmonella enterica subsp. enterica serovar Derby str. CFSAN000566]ECK7273590.1 ribonuclease D [Salm